MTKRLSPERLEEIRAIVEIIGGKYDGDTVPDELLTHIDALEEELKFYHKKKNEALMDLIELEHRVSDHLKRIGEKLDDNK